MPVFLVRPMKFFKMKFFFKIFFIRVSNLKKKKIVFRGRPGLSTSPVTGGGGAGGGRSPPCTHYTRPILKFEF